MAKLVSVYSMLGVAASVDGLPIIGLYDGDDAITVESREDEGSWLGGADGSMIFSQTADTAVKITLKLQHTSPTNLQLKNKLAQQRSGSMIAFPFDVIDVNSLEGSHAGDCLVMKAPTQSYGENATVREWVLESATWQPF